MAMQYDQIQAGWNARGSDGDKIGDIEEVGPNYLLVTKGLFFPTDLYIPTSAITQVDAEGGEVILNVTKSEVEDQGWNEPPVDGYDPTVEGGTGQVAGLGYDGRETTGTAYGRTDETTEGLGYTGADAATTGYADTGTTETDRLRVPVHEEEVRAERVRESAGEVRVRKDVVEENQSMEIPVTRDEVQVRRVSTNREATGDATAFTEGDTIRVPVTAERVEVTKEPRVVEEIEISKRPVTETERVEETVRRERVDVDESDALAGAGTMRTSRSELDDESFGETIDRSDDDLLRR